MKTKNFTSQTEALAYIIKRIDGTVATFDDSDDGGDHGGSADVDASSLLPYSFIMGEAPTHFNGQEFAKVLLERCPEVANYTLEDYGGSDSYLNFSAKQKVSDNMEGFQFDVDSMELILYKYGYNNISVTIDRQELPKTIYQFFYDIGEVEFPAESFSDKYRRSWEISCLEFWIEARYMYNVYLTSADVKKFLY